MDWKVLAESREVGMRYTKWILGAVLSASLPTGCNLVIEGIYGTVPDDGQAGTTGSGAAANAGGSTAVTAGSGAASTGGGAAASAAGGTVTSGGGMSGAAGAGNGGAGPTDGGPPDRCEMVNDCSKADAHDNSDSGEVNISINLIDGSIVIAPYARCSVVGNNDVAFHDLTNNLCSLRGGVVVGGVAKPDDPTINQLEAFIVDGGVPPPFKLTECVVPFYCEDALSIHGAIFHKQ